MKVSEEMINYFKDLFVEVDMVELGEGTSDRDVQFIVPDVNLNNWEATPLPLKKSLGSLSCFLFCRPIHSRIVIRILSCRFISNILFPFSIGCNCIFISV